MLDVDDEDIVIKPIHETAVYLNDNLDIVIKQDWHPDGEMFVVIPVDRINSIYKALYALRVKAKNMLKE